MVENSVPTHFGFGKWLLEMGLNRQDRYLMTSNTHKSHLPALANSNTIGSVQTQCRLFGPFGLHS